MNDLQESEVFEVSYQEVCLKSRLEEDKQETEELTNDRQMNCDAVSRRCGFVANVAQMASMAVLILIDCSGRITSHPCSHPFYNLIFLW